MAQICIVIPARYASTRFPGKPLAKIKGKAILHRVWLSAQKALQSISDATAIVATDDTRIETFCKEISIPCVMTPETCATGTDRVLEAISTLKDTPEFILNLQGDNPFCPSWFIEALIKAYQQDPSIQLATPVVNLSWDALDTLRKNKETTPFSGTCAIIDAHNDALYFSKNIIPAIRNEAKLREQSPMSPVLKHPGLYGYRYDTLQKINNLNKGYYENIEGLEQLRFMEAGIKIRCVKVDYGAYSDFSTLSGIDSPEDIQRAETLLAKIDSTSSCPLA